MLVLHKALWESLNDILGAEGKMLYRTIQIFKKVLHYLLI